MLEYLHLQVSPIMQLMSCWVDPRIACKNTDTAIIGRGWGTPRPVLLSGAKKFHLGCLISFQLPMGFQNFVDISKFTLYGQKNMSFLNYW